MKSIVPIILLAMTFMGFACKRDNKHDLKQEYLIGAWTSVFNETAFSGIDTLRLGKDSCFINSKEVNYRLSDSDFDISIRFRSHAAGHWCLKGDSVFIIYDAKKPAISFDRASFKVMPSKEGADVDALARMNDDMFREVCEFIDNNVSNEYLSMSRDSILLGKILSVSQKELCLTNSNKPCILTRVH